MNDFYGLTPEQYELAQKYMYEGNIDELKRLIQGTEFEKLLMESMNMAGQAQQSSQQAADSLMQTPTYGNSNGRIIPQRTDSLMNRR